MIGGGPAQEQPRKGGHGPAQSSQGPLLLILHGGMEVIIMDVTAILQLVGSYGFPIIMCLLIWQDNRKLEQEMRTLIGSNTAAMTELTAAVKALGGDQP